MNTSIDVLGVMDCAAETLVRMKGAGANPRLVNVQRDALIEARAAVAELIEAANAVADTTPEAQRENWPCHKGITTVARCGRCSRELRLSAALARVKGGAA